MKALRRLIDRLVLRLAVGAIHRRRRELGPFVTEAGRVLAKRLKKPYWVRS